MHLPDPPPREQARPQQVTAAEQAHPERLDSQEPGDSSGDRCPHCGTGLTTPIPPENQHLYGASTHYRRETLVQIDDGHGVEYFVCPDCHGAWPHSFVHNGDPRRTDRHTRAIAAIAAHDEAVAVFADRSHVERVLAEQRRIIDFALGMAGLQWTGWTVAPQMGNRLYLVVAPVAGQRTTDGHRAATQMIANATGWDPRLLSIYSTQAPVVAMMLTNNPDAFTDPPNLPSSDHLV